MRITSREAVQQQETLHLLALPLADSQVLRTTSKEAAKDNRC